MTNKKNVPINYYARDYQTIKDSLVEHAKRYYPSIYKDFSEASFGSLMFDTVSYIGDVLSFYLDYQVNESFLQTSTELNNTLALARQIGYKHEDVPTSYGVVSFFITVPSTIDGLAPDTTYIPILKAGSEFSSQNGALFTLLEDVRFNREDNEIVVAANDEITNLPTYWAIKSYGVVLSGKSEATTIPVGNFERYLKVEVPISNVAEIISVIDSEGKEYYQVENLSQDTIYVPISNKKATTAGDPKSILRTYVVPRRFVVERDNTKTFLQFGNGEEESGEEIAKIVDPASVVLKKNGKSYISDTSFDPTRLIQGNKMGIVPVNTTLSVKVRTNTTENVNVGFDRLTIVNNPILEFADIKNLNSDLVRVVQASLELTNEEKITGQVQKNTTQEIKIRALNSLSSQNRAVTLEDYKSLIYNMPNQFGSIKRVNVLRDANSFTRNLNIYLLSEDIGGTLTKTNEVVKQNLKVWISGKKMINDTIDVLDGKILNLGINYTIVNDLKYNKFEVLNECSNKLREFYSYVREFGEPFFISDVNRVLKEVKGVLDIVDVEIVNKYGGNYSDVIYDVDNYLSEDGRYINVPENVVFEIKFPEDDIKGAVA